MDDAFTAEMQQVNLKLPRALAKAAKRMASQQGMTMAEYYAEALREHLLANAPTLRADLLDEQARLAKAQQENDELLALVHV